MINQDYYVKAKQTGLGVVGGGGGRGKLPYIKVIGMTTLSLRYLKVTFPQQKWLFGEVQL